MATSTIKMSNVVTENITISGASSFENGIKTLFSQINDGRFHVGYATFPGIDSGAYYKFGDSLLFIMRNSLYVTNGTIVWAYTGT